MSQLFFNLWLIAFPLQYLVQMLVITLSLENYEKYVCLESLQIKQFNLWLCNECEAYMFIIMRWNSEWMGKQCSIWTLFYDCDIVGGN